MHPIAGTPPIELFIPSGLPSWQAVLLDLLAAAWAFSPHEMEHDILSVPEGTLHAWRNIFAAVWNAGVAMPISAPGRLHRAIWVAGLRAHRCVRLSEIHTNVSSSAGTIAPASPDVGDPS